MLTTQIANSHALVNADEKRGQAVQTQAKQAHLTHPKSYLSSDLFGPHQAILIMHDSELYQLRLTRQNKLILTK